jgi:hypothetical protein
MIQVTFVKSWAPYIQLETVIIVDTAVDSFCEDKECVSIKRIA